MSPAATEYADLLRQMHALIARGQEQSVTAEALADRMDLPWLAMDDAERQQMRELSAELYALARRAGMKQVVESVGQAMVDRMGGAGVTFSVEEPAIEPLIPAKGGDLLLRLNEYVDQSIEGYIRGQTLPAEASEPSP